MSETPHSGRELRDENVGPSAGRRCQATGQGCHRDGCRTRNRCCHSSPPGRGWDGGRRARPGCRLGQFGITANAVAPGFIATDMTAATAARLSMTFENFQAAVASQVPVRRIGEVDDVAHAISFLASEGAGYVSGQVIYVAGGPLC